MKDLTDLVHIVTKPKIRSAELLGIGQNDHSKLQEFYDLIQKGIANEDEVSQLLYHADKQSTVYQKMRKNLRDRLVNYLFIIDQSHASYTDRQRAYHECCKDWAASKMLFVKNANHAAVSLSRKVLKYARKFEFTDLLMDVHHQLRLYYGTIEGDFVQYQQHNREYKLMVQRWLEENTAEELYIELSIGSVNSKTTQIDVHTKAKQYFDDLKNSLEQYDSYHLHLCGRLIESSIYSSINAYDQLLLVCNRAIDFFTQKGYVAAVPLQIFSYQKAICLLQLRDFLSAQESLKHCLTFMREGDFNWFKAYELSFMLKMHLEQYSEAYDMFLKVTAHSKFKDLPDNIRETWKIAEAYLVLLSELGKLKGLTKPGEKNFRLSKFMNEIQVFSKDKAGMNVPVLILDILFQLLQQNFETLIDREEAIDKYRKRYLNDAESTRSNVFLKMLLQLPRCAFDRAKIIAKSQKELKSLIETPIELANQVYEIEIIPYEKLWEYTLEVLL